jgi:diguanylate cyclase (GGDEF)-like protein
LTSGERKRATGPVNARHRRWWAVIAPLVLLGAVGSVLAARAVARSDDRDQREASLASSTAIASKLGLAIQHEQDLVVTAAAFIAGNPQLNQTQFEQAMSSIHAFERYPELQGIGKLVLVPASKLAAFAAQQVAAGGTFQLTPPGNRPYYCFTTLSQSRSGPPTFGGGGVDVCDTALGPRIMKARDSAQGAYLPYGTGKSAGLVLGTAVYRGSLVPSTVQARRRAFVGWVGIEIVPAVVLDSALDGYPRYKVIFHFEGSASNVSFEAGSAPAGARSMTIDLHNGWHVQTFGGPTVSGLFGDSHALVLLFGGIVFSLLLGLLIFVLGTSRARAVFLVQERTEELRHQAFHDSLTGLSNRALIIDRAGQMLARARRERTPSALLYLDIDDFKDINDTLGHDAGDQLLVGVGNRLSSALREVDTVGRLGGDEFVVLLEGASLATGVQAVADRILGVFETPFEISGNDTPLTVTASIGIAEGDRATPGDLLRDADIALYRAKATGKRRAVLFSPSMQKAVDDHRSLDLDLRRALEMDEYFLLYQPIVELSSGTVIGVEALLRWRHPERGVLSPDVFLPLLESTGLIIPVGNWVLEVACRQGALWQSQGHRLMMSVNLAAAQLGRDRIVDDVNRALASSGFDPSMLTLELTETVLMHDVQPTLSRLELLKAIGVRIAVDDFGTGYSSLAHLRQFPIDVLKIDKSFILAIADSPDSIAIVHTLVQLGKVLGLEIVAEGVESDGQRLRLEAEDVETAQGFFFARPLAVEAVDRLLKQQRGKPAATRIPN